MRNANNPKQKNTNKKKKKPPTILLIILAVLLILAGIIAVIANKNVKAMNHCVDAALNELRQTHTVTPLDVGEYKDLTLYGIMKFHVEQYDVEDLGNLSVMRVNVGLMQMATFVITPQDKNMPLLSADYMYILGNRKSYLEFYDVVKEKDEPYQQLLTALARVQTDYEHLKNVETTPAWYAPLLTVTSYKGGGFGADKDLESLLVNSIHTYMQHAAQLPLLSGEARDEKIAITVEYTDGLIEKGGISTDIFKKELGNEETKKFFDRVFFGTAIQ